MTAGEKKSSGDLSNRLKRPLKASTRSIKSSSSSAISAPPKAAIATGKAKEDLHRRTNPFNEMLRHKTTRDGTSNGPNSESTGNEIKQGEHVARSASTETSGSPQDVDATDRIVGLERALKLAEEEKEALRDELERVKHHGQVYLGAVDSYTGARALSPGNSSRRSSTEMEYEMETPPRRSISAKREEAIEQNYELRDKVIELREQLVEQEAIFKARLEQRFHSRELDWNELTRRLHHAEKESQDRLRQLLDLKQSISALTRMESQVTDSELAETAEQLFHRIREWIIMNFRRIKLVPGSARRDVAESFEAIYPRYSAMNPSDRLPFYQSIIANALMHIFRENVCVGLPTSGPLASLRQVAAYVREAGPEYRAWRRATIRALEKSEAHNTLQQERAAMLHRMLADIEHQFFSVTSTKLTPNAQTSLLAILQTAADMHHTLLLQKAQYQLHFFRHEGPQGSDFDAERMESVNDFDDEPDDDNDSASGRTFSFCVFPSLEKYGDEFGEKMGVRNVLLRARVCSGVG